MEKFDKELFDLEYPKNLVNRIFRRDNIDGYPDDLTGSVQYCLTQLTERHRLILEYRYRDRMTISSVAEELNCSYEQVRNLEMKALSELAHPPLSMFIKYGIKNYIDHLIAEVNKLDGSIEGKISADVLSALRLERDDKLFTFDDIINFINECNEHIKS